MVFAAVKPVERLAAQELAFVIQNGILTEFSDIFFQFRNETRLGVKSPRFGNLDIEEGLVIVHNDATGLPFFIDAEHLNYKPFFVLAEFFGVSIASIAAATATV